MLRCIGAALVCLSCPVADALEVVDLTNTRVDIELDGRLDESLWTDLPAETDFTVVQPPSGDTPIYSTEARAFYTKDGLYAAVRAFQPPEHLIKRLSARDLRMRRDSVTVAIDTSGTGIYGYIFTISLGGAKRDGVILPERSYTWEWDGPWVGETASDEDGWTAELFLPWSMVTMPQAEKRNIGMYISRHVGYLDQVWSHPALPRTQPRFLSAFAPHDMSNVEPKPNYSIYPFTSLSHERTESDGEFRAGADAFWQISPQLKLTATLLPDFGQIEQDDVDINFTAFETFFPEKRPFFLEGQEIFETGITNLVFTRRIGEVPRPRGLPDGFSANELDLITNRDLLGAAKVTGQSGEFRYGLLTAFEDDTDVRASDGNETIIVQETGRNFAAIRGLWERANGPYRGIGFLATAVDTPDEIREVLEFDGAYRSADGNVALRGQLMGSSVAGENDAGFSGDFVFRPILGHTHTATLQVYGDSFNIRDFGFLRRNDLVSVEYEYHLQEASANLARKRDSYVEVEYEENTVGERVELSLSGRQSWELYNQDSVSWEAEMVGSRFDDRNSRGNGSFEVDSGYDIELGYETDSAKRVSIESEFRAYSEDLGGSSTSFLLGTRLNPSDQLSMGLSLTYSDRNAWLVHQGNGQLTTFDAIQWEANFDASVFFSAKQQLRAIWQWVALSAEEVDRFQVDPTARALEGVASIGPRQDFSRSDTWFQIRYRWEFAPLSDFFLVYARSGRIDTSRSNDFDDLLQDVWQTPISEQFVVKLRYRFSP